MDALIGYSGFVGSTLLKQRDFSSLYRSTNIGDIKGKQFDTIICAGAPAQKWLANKEPQDDLNKINSLIEILKTVECKKFILISTVDVFHNPVDIDETSEVDTKGLHAYGLHRFYLEQFVKSNFDDSLIIRLPGLIGPGLKKNIIYDFLHNNNISQIESRGTFQFYPMINLWSDIQIALNNDLKLVHFTCEPISVADVARQGFGFEFENHVSNNPGNYNLKTIYGPLFDGSEGYQYNRRESLMAIRAYAQSEPMCNVDTSK